MISFTKLPNFFFFCVQCWNAGRNLGTRLYLAPIIYVPKHHLVVCTIIWQCICVAVLCTTLILPASPSLWSVSLVTKTTPVGGWHWISNIYFCQVDYWSVVEVNQTTPHWSEPSRLRLITQFFPTCSFAHYIIYTIPFLINRNGFSPPAVVVHPNARYGQGTGPVLLHELLCTGTETRLLDCPHPGINTSRSVCSHRDDAGVSCSRSKCPLSPWSSLYSIVLV